MVASSDEQPSQVLLIGSSAQTAKLATRIASTGIEPVPAGDLQEARSLLTRSHGHIEVALVPGDKALEDDRALRGLLRARSNFTAIAYGKPLGSRQRKQLREAGVRLALWDPFDDGALRFQINRALCHDRDVHRRRAPRVPTYMLSRIEMNGRARDVIIYSLSPGGAFLETPRSSMPDASVRLELRLPTGALTCSARVLFTNVPGNLQRENLPLGMGVVFEGLTSDLTKAIEAYISERLEDLTV